VFALLVLRFCRDAETQRRTGKQDASCSRDVDHCQPAWGVGDQALVLVQIHGVQRAAGSGGGTGEPHLASGWPPGEPPKRCEFACQGRPVALKINHHYGARAVSAQGVIDERDPIAARGEPDLADPTAGAIDHTTGGIFDAG
jgi:hypothetical protein